MNRRQKLRQQKAADERYKQLVQLAPDGILIHDGERIVLANASAVRLAGATRRTQLVGLPIDTFLTPPFLKAVEAELRDPDNLADMAVPVRDTFHRLDGSELEVEVRAVAFMDHGRPSAHLVIRDISERLAAERAARQLQDRLEHAQRMESIGMLAGGVAHEVNNMMQVIIGFGEFLLNDARVPEECRPDVREILVAAERAAFVTRQLLSFSQRDVPRPEAIDLSSAVRATESALLRLLGAGRRLVLRTQDVRQVWVDPSHLQQIIINLALNARDAMRDGGTLTIETKETYVSSGTVSAEPDTIPSGWYVTLTVQDSGEGMDAATVARCFEPFFTTKALGAGSGLGLAAVHGLMKQNNGHITVASELGTGTTFTVYLPVLSDPTQAVSHTQPSAKPPEPNSHSSAADSRSIPPSSRSD